MTGKQKLKALLDEWDVPYYEDGKEIVIGSSLDVKITDSPKVDGYIGFYAAFEFGADGTFAKVGIWELWICCQHRKRLTITTEVASALTGDRLAHDSRSRWRWSSLNL